MYDILSFCAVLLSFKLFYVFKGPSRDVHFELAKPINVVVFCFCLDLTLVPMQINKQKKDKIMQQVRKHMSSNNKWTANT